jgi:hypothetical protein
MSRRRGSAAGGGQVTRVTEAAGQDLHRPDHRASNFRGFGYVEVAWELAIVPTDMAALLRATLSKLTALGSALAPFSTTDQA